MKHCDFDCGGKMASGFGGAGRGDRTAGQGGGAGFEADGFNQGANSFGAKPNKAKQNGLHLFGLTWFYLAESGLSNGLRAKK